MANRFRPRKATYNANGMRRLGGPSACTRRQMLALSAGAVLGACASTSHGNGASASAPTTPPDCNAERKPNIIIYLADALRADALGVYNPQAPYTPFLDEFARESIVFEKCFSQATWTKPSIASLYTGVLKGLHQTVLSGLDQGIHVLRDDFLTLAEALRDSGYRTGLFLANVQVVEEMGFRQGFDHYQYILAQPAEEQARDVLAWVDSLQGAPFFAFVHELDPHGPYTPEPETYQKLFGASLDDAYDALCEGDRALLRQFKYFYVTEEEQPKLQGLLPEGRRYLRNLYLGEVHEVDAVFRWFYGELRKRALLDNSFLIFTSDHGESLGEHELFYHQNFMYWPEIHIPALVRPPLGGNGVRVETAVGLYDLYPTLLAIAGAEAPDYVRGKPLFDEKGRVSANLDGHVFVQVARQRPDPKDWITGIVDGELRVAWDPDQNAFRVGRLFGSTPYTEDESLSPELQRRVPLLCDRIRVEMERLEGVRQRLGPPAFLPMDGKWEQWGESLTEDLRALGYM